MCPTGCHVGFLTVMEIFRSPLSVDLPCDSSRSYVDCGCKDQEVVHFEGASMAVKYKIKAFKDNESSQL